MPHCTLCYQRRTYVYIRRNREECTRLLTLLVSATRRLIKPYALPMLRVLLQKVNDGNAAVAANVLMCLGELTCVGGEDVMPHVPELMQVIMAKLSDPSIAKRDAALHTLGQVCGSTGYVIAPLVDYPQLLPALGRILRTDPAKEVRREVMKVLGILGALDPFRRKVCP
jgi:serine/threonine-protein kinase mTOR